MPRDPFFLAIKRIVREDPNVVLRTGIGSLSGLILGRATGRGAITTGLLTLGGGIGGAKAPDLLKILRGGPIFTGTSGFGQQARSSNPFLLFS